MKASNQTVKMQLIWSWKSDEWKRKKPSDRPKFDHLIYYQRNLLYDWLESHVEALELLVHEQFTFNLDRY